MSKPSPFGQLLLVRYLQFIREPEAIFWTFGFPLIMVVVLGLAFRNKQPDAILVDISAPESFESTITELLKHERLDLNEVSIAEGLERLRTNRCSVLLEIDATGGVTYHLDPTNPESAHAKLAIDDALQRALGRMDAAQTQDNFISAPGSRYIDFLVPGLIGMNLMGGGLWGVGFVIVDMRVRQLLKRLLATPMRRADFLLSMVGGRAMFFFPEMLFLLIVAYLIFGVPINGDFFSLVAIAFIGAITFAGIGLLIASRARRIEEVAGLMNLVMVPMWLLSGIFFSSSRFPDFMQPLIRALPLTQLIDALRAIMIDGESLLQQGVPILVLGIWGAASFALALRWFRWI